MKNLILVLLFLIYASGSFGNYLPKSFHAKITQELESIGKKSIKRSTGTLDYKSPAQLRLEITKPEQVTWVSNSKKTWIYNPPFIEGEPGQLTIRPAGELRIGRFFDALQNGLKSNKLYKVSKEKDHVALIFSSTLIKETGVKSAKLFFSGNEQDFLHLKTVELEYQDRKGPKIILDSLTPNKKFPTNHFVFTPPENTEINH